MFRSDPRTFDSLKKLWGLCTSSKKPLLIWVGAGASSWLGYERWAELAERFHKAFSRTYSGYAKADGMHDLDQKSYAAVFQRCHDTDSQQYFSMLAEALAPRKTKPVFERFLAALRSAERISIVTTNVDETLERSLPTFELVQRSDLARAISLVASRTQFIGKLHGSISAIESAVFATQDYELLLKDETYIDVLRFLLTTCSVVFIGYSLRDQYLFDLITRNARLLSLFGDGPHFLVSAEDRHDLPESVNVIQYGTDIHTDHRSSILVVELLRRPIIELDPLSYERPASHSLQSAYFLSDFYPAGTWTSGNTWELKETDGTRVAEMAVGPDWSAEEFPNRTATAAYDLAVGLICFDCVFLPIECVGRAHQVLQQHFWTLVLGDILRFVRWEGLDGLMFMERGAGWGVPVTGTIQTQTTMEILRRQLAPAPGKEAEAAAMFTVLEDKTKELNLSGTLNFADVCSGLFVSPATRKILGLLNPV